MIKNKNLFPAAAGAVFLLDVIIAVSVSWVRGRHLFDLGISFSSYAGMYRSVSVIYFLSLLVILPLIAVYTVKTKMPRVKKLVYAVVFLCVFGAAFFPFNTYSDAPTPLTIDLHNDFAIALMLAVTVSFVITVFTARDKRQRICAVLSIAYAAAFIVLYFMSVRALFEVFFICEILFIALLLLGLHMEQYGERAEDKE